MAIISISLKDSLIKDIDKLQKEHGYSGRSEIIRSGLRLLISSEKEKSKLKGDIGGIVVVVNEERYNEEISKIRHDYSSIIKTQIHNHLESHKCLQIFVVEGDSKILLEMVNNLEISKKAEYLKLIIT